MIGESKLRNRASERKHSIRGNKASKTTRQRRRRCKDTDRREKKAQTNPVHLQSQILSTCRNLQRKLTPHLHLSLCLKPWLASLRHYVFSTQTYILLAAVSFLSCERRQIISSQACNRATTF